MVGVFLASLFFGLLNVQWFATESIAAYYEMLDESNEDGLNGGIWWSLLAVLLSSIALGPIAAALTILTYRNKDVSDAWMGQIYGLLSGIPTALIWALIWLICLPFTWGLLPWGVWRLNWWKIFPFGFGLIWMGGLPLLIIGINFFKKLANPEYNHDLNKLAEEVSEEEPNPPPVEEKATEIYDPYTNKTTRLESGKIVGRLKVVIGIFLGILFIPGIVFIIIGAVMGESFLHEGISDGEMQVEDADGNGDLGFIIYVEGEVVDFNVNGIWDYCEGIVVSATHSGGWVSDPWTSQKFHNGPDETRQTFQLETGGQNQPGSNDCSTQIMPQGKSKDGISLVKLGRACYGCTAGTSTISAEYENEPTKPVRMWIQDGEVAREATTLMIVGGVMVGSPIVYFVILFIVKAHKAKREAGIMPRINSVDEPIEIIESIPGQPIRFRINNPPKGGDAWVGIYPLSTGDQDHGDRWRWLRDIDVNNATLPGQSAGKWSIRVFKDGGYKLEHRVDFEIQSPSQQSSTPTSSNDIVEGKVAFKSVHGKYLSAQPDGRAEWNRDRANAWEYFHLEKRKGGKIALKGAHGKYVSAQPDGSVQINRGAAPPGGWEEFTVEHHFIQSVGRGGYDVVRLKSSHGKYLSAQSDGRVEWNRDHAPPGGWEDIDMEYTGNATITTSKSTYTIDESIDFSFTASKLPDDAWIGIVPVAIPHGDEAVNDSHDISYAHLGGRTNGDITLPNPGLGTWTLRLHDTDNNGRELTHVVFEVVSSLGSSGSLHKGRNCEINILEARSGKPIRFNVNNRPSGNEAWFGLYPVQATDHDHGEQHQNWMYFRDVGRNEISLPTKSAGRWSIRVFSDGGFNMIKRLDFDIIKIDEKSTQSAKKIQSALKQSKEGKKTNFWDSVN